ncbi:DsbC family protein, partial [Sulfurimonas sp.]|uniref:DsbC family protein n=1 Tax=Sulfurimonas sp. TaxID=2022749 RepID=UPI0025E64022
NTELQFLQTLLPNTNIAKYQKSGIDGFYEVYFDNGQIIYANPFKEIMLFGEIMNKNGYSITANKRLKWQEELTNKAMQNTPVDKLLKPAKKATFNKGSQNDYSFVLFTDPECPFCKTVENFFAENDTTVHYVFTPLPFHKNAKEWSQIALSSKDFKKALEDIHSGSVPKIAITEDAKKQLEEMEILAKELKVAGTPKIYVIDSKKQEIVQIINGADIPKLEVYLK